MVRKEIDQPTRAQILIDQPAWEQGGAQALLDRLIEGVGAGDDEAPGHGTGLDATVHAAKFPATPIVVEVEEQAGRLRNVAGLAERRRGAGPVRRCADPVAGGEETHADQVSGETGAQADGQINPLGDEVDGRVGQHKLHGHLGVKILKVTHQGDEAAGAEGDGGGDPQHPHRPGSQRLRLVSGVVQPLQQGLDALEIGFSRLRHREAAGGALEQAKAQFRLQRGNGPGDLRRLFAGVSRDARKSAVATDIEGKPKGVQIHIEAPLFMHKSHDYNSIRQIYCKISLEYTPVTAISPTGVCKMNIKGSVALVTGANRGVGRELVSALVEAGAAKVYAAARDVSGIVGSTYVVPVVLDITDAAQIAAARTKLTDVTLLINNAGVLDFGSALEAPIAAFERNMAVNVYGGLNVTRAFAPVIAGNGGGGVVNLLSVVALASMPGLAAYNASKAALHSLTQSFRATLKSQGIEVFGVYPGPVDTDMAAEIPFDKTSPAVVARAILKGVGEGREDIFPDPMSEQVAGVWAHDPKGLERQFSAM